MNEVEKRVVNNFRESNKENVEYMCFTDEEILKIHPVTPYDYIDYYDYLISKEKQNIKSCEKCISELQNERKLDYTRKRENLEFIKEETLTIKMSQAKIDEYKVKKEKYLEQIDKDHIR